MTQTPSDSEPTGTSRVCTGQSRRYSGSTETNGSYLAELDRKAEGAEPLLEFVAAADAGVGDEEHVLVVLSEVLQCLQGPLDLVLALPLSEQLCTNTPSKSKKKLL